MTLRVQKTDGTWLPLDAKVTERNAVSVTVYVPEWRGTWILGAEGMYGNVGGNDWRIYTIHPDDCKALMGGALL